VISNEPGYYEDGNFGIRIENIIMVPYCRKLIDESLLTKREKNWLNEYHADVHAKTKDYFRENELAMKWLERETVPF
jgi:Xaa-Pro aminopeptidase